MNEQKPIGNLFDDHEAELEAKARANRAARESAFSVGDRKCLQLTWPPPGLNPVKCGKPAKFVVNFTDDRAPMPVCGIHARNHRDRPHRTLEEIPAPATERRP